MPSWAAPNPTTQATVARASKAFLREAAMAAKERLAGWLGAGAAGSPHCIEAKASKAKQHSADPGRGIS